MNTLLVYPEFPDTFWSFKHALSFVGKKASFPPLGLITIAPMLPESWNRRLVDLNVQPLRDRDLEWADCVFISAMAVQEKSARSILERCHKADILVVAGGPLFTMEPDSFSGVDHFILNEAEITLPRFLEDLSNGCAKRVYSTNEFADMSTSPAPDWSLVRMKKYHSVGIQYSRGCPFNCDFCNITSLLGRKVRTKTTEQILAELDSLHASGWRGNIFFVDDNFIGNKHRLKVDLLPRLIAWRKRKRGVSFHTEASINLADDDELMELMFRAGFDMVFVGIETPDDLSLAECSKKQNEKRDLVADVKRIQRAGLQVQAGFIVGFDADKPSVFSRQIEFIQRSGITTAMVGLLQAPKGTRLYERMESEGRLRDRWTGDNVEGTTNIVTKMDSKKLYDGYRSILHHIYSPKNYYDRVKTFLIEYRLPVSVKCPAFSDIMAFFKSIVRLGIIGKERLQYWKLVFWTFFRRPRLIAVAVTLAINGYHFRRVCELHVR